VVGDDFVSIGSDYDGMITPPRDMADATCYPRLVQYMLERGWSEARIRKVLGENFLRVFEALRP
jgi:membrane dipeptidase